MGLFDWLLKRGSGQSPDFNDAAEHGHVIAPSSRYPHAVDAISALIEQIEDGQWATFEAIQPDGESVIVQVAGNEINTCDEEVDLPSIARLIGLDALAATIAPGGRGGNDPTMHVVPDASAAELAELIHGVFTRHFGCAPDDRLEGYLED